MNKKFMPVYTGNLRSHMIQVPEVIYQCSGIVIFGKRMKSIVFSTDVAVIRNCNADAVIAVYPFTPQPIITHALMLAADVPVTTIQKLLGHRWLETTQIYVAANDRQVAADYYAACAKLEDWS